jgi:hypothetical protein
VLLAGDVPSSEPMGEGYPVPWQGYSAVSLKNRENPEIFYITIKITETT